MTAAVFDTNVIVSGVLSPFGTPGRLLDAILDGFCLPVVSDTIMEEYEDVLNRPTFRFSPSKTRLLLAAIRSRAVYAPFAPFPTAHVLPDPDDAIFVEAALGLHVPLVTASRKHFPPHAVGGAPVLSPSTFLARIA